MELKTGNSQVVAEASRWFIECRAGELDPASRREFVRWLKRSPEHIRSYIEVSSAYCGVPDADLLPANALNQLIDRTRARMLAEGNVLPLDPAEPDKHSRQVLAGYRSSARLRPALLVAALVLGSVALAFWQITVRGVYTTDIGEQRSIYLEDGSRVELNAGSKIRVRLNDRRRGIELLKGEALFQVAKDEHRPFIVTTGDAQLRALGTRFDVDRRLSRTIVSVVEGRVALSAALAPGKTVTADNAANSSVQTGVLVGAPILLSAGEQAVITRSSAYKAEHMNTTAATAWTHGEVEFDETPLPEVADEFNRHNRRRLVIDEPELASIRITCVYSLDDAASLIRFLQKQSDLSLTIVGGEIHVSRKK